MPLSYRLHAELAAEHDGVRRWGYRRLECGSLDASVKESDLAKRSLQVLAAAAAAVTQNNGHGEEEKVQHGDAQFPAVETNGRDETIEVVGNTVQAQWAKLPKQDDKAASLLTRSMLPADLDWVDGTIVTRYNQMGRQGATETAQVHPLQFTEAIAQLAEAAGVTMRMRAKVTRIYSTRVGVSGIEFEDGEAGGASCILGQITDVVVAAGPWTGVVLPRSKVDGIRAHSVVFDVDVAPYAVFTNISLPPDWTPEHRSRKGQKRKHGGTVDPEMYARPGGEVYACGELLCPRAQHLSRIAYMTR